MPANDYGGAADVVVEESDPWPNSNTTHLGMTGKGLNVYYTQAGAGFFDKGATITLTQAQTSDNSDYMRADGFWNSDYQEIMRARERARQQQTGGSN